MAKIIEIYDYHTMIKPKLNQRNNKQFVSEPYRIVKNLLIDLHFNYNFGPVVTVFL